MRRRLEVLAVLLFGLSTLGGCIGSQAQLDRPGTGTSEQAIAAVKQTKHIRRGKTMDDVVTYELPISDKAAGLINHSLGWTAEPTDEVDGGGWRVSYRWEREDADGVYRTDTVSAVWLYNPRTGTVKPASDWAFMLMGQY